MQASDIPLILVIDDEPTVAHTIEATFADGPFEVACAPDGAAGLMMLRERRPSLVLLDLALPGIDGWNVLQRIREDDETADIPVVIVTAHGDSETTLQARERGANGMLPKPFRPRDLRRVVNELLGGPVAAAL